PENVLRFDFRAVGIDAAEDDAAAGDLTIIDDDESAEQRVPIGIIHDERAAGLDGDFGNIVARDVVAAGEFLERGGVDDALDAHDLSIELLRSELDLGPLADGEVPFAHPEKARLETIRFNRRIRFVRGDVAALDEDLLGERDADAFARVRRVALRRVPI